MENLSNGVIAILILSVKRCLSDEIRIGVILPESFHYPWGIHRVLPAIDLAVERVRHDVLSGTSIEIIVADSDCSETKSALEAFQLRQKDVHVILGPVCNYAVAAIARFSPYWNIPIITAGASVREFDNKSKFDLLTRIHETTTQMAESVIHFTRVFNWQHIGLIYEDNAMPSSSIKSDCYFKMVAIYFKLKGRYGTEPPHQKFDRNSDFEDILRSASSRARVFVVCGSPDSTRELMIKAHELELDRGDHVFINLGLKNRNGETNRPWYRHNDSYVRNNMARSAYETLMTITLRDPQHYSYMLFSNYVKRRTMEMYSDVKYGEETVNSFVGAFHDAVLLYALAVNDTIEAGESLSNGTAVTERMWGRTFNGITGVVAMDEKGDRLMDYSLLDMDPQTGQYHVVATYFGKSKTVDFVPGKRVHFGVDFDDPPSDIPHCGFDYSKCTDKDDKIGKTTKMNEMLADLQISFDEITAAVEEHRKKLTAITKLIKKEQNK